MDPEEFRAYLHEMVGLGILAPNNDGRGWHLRSPNVLRMIGSPDEVTAELLSAASESVPSEFIALSARRTLRDGRRAPLTAQQVDDLLGDHANQVRLVLGSAGTGVDAAADTVRAVCADLGQRFELVETRSRKQFEDALVDGRPGQRRVVLSDLAVLAAKDESCVTALEAALMRLPTRPGVTRSVVLISGPDQLGFWQGLFDTDERPGIGLVTLRRHDRRTLRVWSFDSGYFGTEDRQARLLEVTGGWPILVERAVTRVIEKNSEDAALESLREEMTVPEVAAKFIDDVGLTADPWIMAAFDDIVQLAGADRMRHSDLVAAAGFSGRHPAPAAAVACLDALCVFDLEGQDAYRVSELLVRCWAHRREPDAP
jgi:hypothetical protein